jgi:hypothetical protein
MAPAQHPMEPENAKFRQNRVFGHGIIFLGQLQVLLLSPRAEFLGLTSELMSTTRKHDGKTSSAPKKTRGPYISMVIISGFRRKRDYLTPIGRWFLGHKIFVELRIAGLHVQVRAHR